MRKQVSFRVALLATVLAGCGPASVPANPSWDQDVFPILQGSCNHCHGATVKSGMLPLSRMDVCYSRVLEVAQIPLPLQAQIFGAVPLSGSWSGDTGFLIIQKGKSRPSMPPPPAAPLSDYERDVLLTWAKKVQAANHFADTPHPACTKQTRNRNPTAVVVEQKVNDDDELVVTLDVSDPDGDQVLGKVSAGTEAAKPIISSGRSDYIFPGLAVGVPVKVILHDGFVESPVELDL